MHILKRAQRKRPYYHSPVYDMESFFWCFLFEILRRARGDLTESEKYIIDRVVSPNFGCDMMEESSRKSAVLKFLRREYLGWDVEYPHLTPIKTLMVELASKVFHFYEIAAEGILNEVVCDEDKVIVDYLSAFKTCLSELECPAGATIATQSGDLRDH